MYYYRANSDSDSDFDDGVDYEMTRQLLLKKGDREGQKNRYDCKEGNGLRMGRRGTPRLY